MQTNLVQKLWLTLSVSCLLPALSWAQTPQAEELGRLGDEIVLLDARLKAMQARTKLAEEEKKLDALNTVSFQRTAVDPVLLAVEGVGDRMVATLSMDPTQSSQIVEVKSGDLLMNGWRVMEISSHQVLLSKGKAKKVLRLGLSQSPPAVAAQELHQSNQALQGSVQENINNQIKADSSGSAGNNPSSYGLPANLPPQR